MFPLSMILRLILKRRSGTSVDFPILIRLFKSESVTQLTAKGLKNTNILNHCKVTSYSTVDNSQNFEYVGCITQQRLNTCFSLMSLVVFGALTVTLV